MSPVANPRLLLIEEGAEVMPVKVSRSEQILPAIPTTARLWYSLLVFQLLVSVSQLVSLCDQCDDAAGTLGRQHYRPTELDMLEPGMVWPRLHNSAREGCHRFAALFTNKSQ